MKKIRVLWSAHPLQGLAESLVAGILILIAAVFLRFQQRAKEVRDDLDAL